MADEQQKIFYVHETTFQSTARDVFTFATFVAVVVAGKYLDSTALEWAGVILAFLSLMGRANGLVKRLTISEVRAELDKLERENEGGAWWR